MSSGAVRRRGRLWLSMALSAAPLSIGGCEELSCFLSPELGECLRAYDEAQKNLPPQVTMQINPQPALAGQAVKVSAAAYPHRSSKARRIREIDLDLDGDGTYETDGIEPFPHASEAFVSFPAPGEYRVGAEARDQDQASRTSALIEVSRSGPPPPPPPSLTAVLEVSPNPAGVGETVTFSGASSTGPITDYAWDLDGEPGFELHTAGSQTTRSYPSPRQHEVALQVTGSAGEPATDTETLTICGEPPCAGRARAAAASRFSARLVGFGLRGHEGRRKRRGQRVTIKDAIGIGTAESAEPFLDGSFILGADGRRNLRTAASRIRIAYLLRFSDIPGTVCMRGRVKSRPGKRAKGRVRIVGGTGDGATVAGRARFRVGGSPRVPVLKLRGSLDRGAAPARPPDAACEALETAVFG